MFSQNHIIWLILLVVLITISLIISRTLKFKSAAFVLFFVSLFNEFIKIMNNIIPNTQGDGFILEQTNLPLHLCSIMIFIYFALPFLAEGTLKERIKSFVTVIGLLGAIFAILIPINGTSFSKITTYQYFIYHGAMIYFSLYLIFTDQVDLRFKPYISNLVSIFALGIIMIWINSALSVYGTNFFFVVKPPMQNLPILNLNNGWHAYFFTIIGIGIFTITLVHLPALIKEFFKK